MMSVRKKIVWGLSVGACLWGSASWAATVRAYEKEDVSRIVIESTKTPSYVFKKMSHDTYHIELSQETLDEGISSIQNLARVSNSSLHTQNTLILTLPSATRIKHFKTGQKIIIDLQGTAPKKTGTPLKSLSVKTQKGAPINVPPVQQTHTGDNNTVHLTHDHVAQITATETISVAAFIRHNVLWLVVDKPDFLIPPQIKGRQQDLFAPFERIELPQATAFKTSLPYTDTPLYFYAEGGGLIWRVILTPDQEKAKEGKTLIPTDTALEWGDSEAHRVIQISDPDFEDQITVVTSKKVSASLNQTTDYVELTSLPSFIGLAFLPKTEDIKISLQPEKIILSRPSGLHVSAREDLPHLFLDHRFGDTAPLPLDDYKNLKRIYRFDEWQMGGMENLPDNKRLLLSSASGKESQDRVNDLMKLARLKLSNGRAAEAIGFINLTQDLYPEIAESPEFIALRGAAHALSGQHDLAFEDFNHPALKPYDEITLWKAYSLAGLEDWNQARTHLPPDVGMVSLYPAPLQHKLALVLAEIALRQGRIRDGEDLLSLVRDHSDILPPSDTATLKYLSGEAARQQTDFKEAIALWTPLTTGSDDFYRAKAGLALTRLLYEDKKISPQEAIDRLERLRYAWRGDDLETQINYRLGQTYLDNKNYIQGLNIMRKAASRSPDPELAQEIASNMTQAFHDVFTTERINELDPLDTITLYEEFSELSPAGQDGQRLIQNLAERLIEIDLLGRAATLLKTQVDQELSGKEGAQIALRLASIELADQKPSLALKSLRKAETFLKGETGDLIPLKHNIGLLKAHAYSLLKRPDNALITLSRLHQNAQTLQMRADIAWRASRWQDASDALEELINRENINLNTPLSDDHRDLILNWAVTLNLSDNRYVLNSSRERFGSVMKQTNKAQEFDVITRPHQNVFLADRKTIENIVAEVDIFKGFLENYKKDVN